jgi:hypothetical protein
VDKDVTWAYGCAGFSAAKIVEINDIQKIVYIDLIRTEKKRPVAFVVPATIIFTIVNLGS